MAKKKTAAKKTPAAKKTAAQKAAEKEEPKVYRLDQGESLPAQEPWPPKAK